MLSSSVRKYLATGSLEGFSEGIDHSDVSVEVETTGDIVNDIAVAVEAVDEASTDYDTLVEAAAAIEGYVDLMRIGEENGGLTPMTAAAVRLGIEQWENKLGLDSQIVASVEEFGGTSSQLHATQVSIESAGDTLKKLWEGLKRLLAFISQKVKELGKTLTDGAFRLQQRALKVAAKAQQAKGEPKSAKIDVAVSSFSANGDVLTVDQVKAFAQSVGTGFVNATERYVSGVATAAASLDPKAGDAFYTGLGGLVEQLGNYVPGEGFQAVEGGEVSKRWADSQAWRSKTIMPGNKSFYIVVPSKEIIQKDEKGKSIVTVIGKVHAGMYPVQGAGSVGTEKRSVDVKSAGEIHSAARKISDVAKAISEMSRKADMSKSIEAVRKAGETITSKGSGDDAAANNAAAQVVRALTHTQKLLHGPSHKGLAAATSALGGQLRMLEQMLASYTEGGSEASSTSQAALPAPAGE